jgi:glycyl-tRNA synthetase
MFKIDDDEMVGYLRPDIAQTMFVEFKTFHKTFNKSLPFGLAQVGKSCIKKIPTKSLTNLREFTQAEVVYFFDPLYDAKNDEHYNLYFNLYGERRVPILSAKNQERGEDSIFMFYDEIEDQQINKYVVMNIHKLYMVAMELAIHDLSIMRIRQLLKHELDNQTFDCWSLEIRCNYKWLECARTTYRGDYDLSVHNIESSSFVFRENTSVAYIPHVVVASIYIDRLIYAMLAHKIKYRQGFNTRYVLTHDGFAPCLVMITLSVENELSEMIGKKFVSDIYYKLRKCGITCRLDNSTTHIEADELGIAMIITIDSETLDSKSANYGSVMVRDRDSGQQSRHKIESLPRVFERESYRECDCGTETYVFGIKRHHYDCGTYRYDCETYRYDCETDRYDCGTLKPSEYNSYDKDVKPTKKFQWLSNIQKKLYLKGIIFAGSIYIGLYILGCYTKK